MAPTKVTDVTVRDMRFPTSLDGPGSDAMNRAPDFSCSYVVFRTDSHLEGHGFTFTQGRGTQIVCHAVSVLSRLVVGQPLDRIYGDFGQFWRSLTSEDQMRWLGPEKGVMHLAVAAITNALWDLWAKMEGKPLWKLLVDMEPEKLVSTIDFRYMTDALTPQEAIDMLKKSKVGWEQREKEMQEQGFPGYTMSCGWMGYDDAKIQSQCKKEMAEGFTSFKAKIGVDLANDKRRLRMIRETIGPDNLLMVDSNERWDVPDAIAWMKELAEFNIHWIEEPTSPDDVLGHLEIAKALNPLGIRIATGEVCQNRVMFKQFLASGAMQFCQIDACRLGGVNENVAVILMANKYGVPVCPHGGGVGLCELVQHLSIFDYISVCGNLKDRMTEYADTLHEHFKSPCVMKGPNFMPPKDAGFSSDMKETSLADYEWPTGKVWQRLIAEGKYSLE